METTCVTSFISLSAPSSKYSTLSSGPKATTKSRNSFGDEGSRSERVGPSGNGLAVVRFALGKKTHNLLKGDFFPSQTPSNDLLLSHIRDPSLESRVLKHPVLPFVPMLFKLPGGIESFVQVL
jgi:hypothetical protein